MKNIKLPGRMIEMKNKELKKRIIQISYDRGLSHLGSNLSSVDIIDDIYANKRRDEKFVLSAGHCGLALYTVLEKYEDRNADELFNKHGVHPNKDIENGLWCSSGSLGQGLPIALGMALADRGREVHCLISDGEMAEGSMWEALRIKTEQCAENLKIHLNMNGMAAYDRVPRDLLEQRVMAFDDSVQIHHTTVEQFPFLRGISAHYHTMSKDDYSQAMLML